jgi:uncharacterized protein YaaQ
MNFAAHIFIELSSKRNFRETQLSDTYNFLKGINTFLPLFTLDHEGIYKITKKIIKSNKIWQYFEHKSG